MCIKEYDMNKRLVVGKLETKVLGYMAGLQQFMASHSHAGVHGMLLTKQRHLAVLHLDLHPQVRSSMQAVGTAGSRVQTIVNLPLFFFHALVSNGAFPAGTYPDFNFPQPSPTV